jgi:multiple sugar transport system permease protein
MTESALSSGLGRAPSEAPSAAQGRRAARRSIQRSNQRYALGLMAPAGVVIVALVGWPVVRLCYDSLFAGGQLGSAPRKFVGLQNYFTVFHTPELTQSAVRTLIYTVFVVAMEFVLGLAAALLFDALGKSSRFLRTAFLYPLMVAPVVAGLLWRFLMIDNFGILNELLHRAHILNGSQNIGWLTDTHIVLFSVAVPDIWLTTSFMTLILFAGLQALPADVYEAARLDGAKGFQLLWRITLPLLRPVIAVALIIRGVDAARAFDVIRIMTNGGPQNASETLSLSIYNTSVRFGEQGLGSAAAVLFLIVMMLVAVTAVLTIWRPGGDAA